MVDLSNLAATFQTALAGGASGSHTTVNPRVPMYFTSTLRQRIANATQPSFFADITGATLYAPYEGLSSTVFRPTIAMAVNPNSIQWRQPKRIQKVDTREGSTFFHFTNDQGQNNDILTLEFRGNTGILDLRGSLPGVNGQPNTGPDTGALNKLLIWQNLYAMTREPMLLSDNTQNDFTILYSSKVFPIEIELHGHYSTVLEFTEESNKPNSLNYSFAFTVTATEPPLDLMLQSFADVLVQPPNFSNAQLDENVRQQRVEASLQNIDSAQQILTPVLPPGQAGA